MCSYSLLLCSELYNFDAIIIIWWHLLYNVFQWTEPLKVLAFYYKKLSWKEQKKGIDGVKYNIFIYTFSNKIIIFNSFINYLQNA